MDLGGLLPSILSTLIATIVVIVVIVITHWISTKLLKELKRAKFNKAVRFQRLTIFSGKRISNGISSLIKTIRALVYLVILFFYIPIILSFFPATAEYTEIIFGYIQYPISYIGTGFIGYLPNIFQILIIILLARYTLKVIRFFFRAISRGAISFPGFYKEWAMPTYSITRFLIFIFASVTIFPLLPGAQSPAFQGISIFLAALFSLGSTAAVSNVIAGVLLTYTRAFQIGDRVQIGDTIGDVTERTLLASHIRTIKNESVTIPNSEVLASHTINYSTMAEKEGLILHAVVTIGYNVPWDKVHKLLIKAAKETGGLKKRPGPFVYQTALQNSAVEYEINAYTSKPNEMADIYSELRKNILDNFNKAKIEILSPIYTSIRDGNETTLPSKNRKKGYEAPGFKMFTMPTKKSGK